MTQTVCKTLKLMQIILTNGLQLSNILLTHTHTHTHTQLLINKIFSDTAATLNSKAPCACCKASEWCFFYNYSFIN